MRPAGKAATRLLPGDLMQAIHGENIYDGFDHRKYPSDLRGWGGDSPVFGELVREVRPSLIIEVGSWKGASAVSMAEAVRQAGLDAKILCIDTWLGALEFRMDQNDVERFQALESVHGYPSVYYRFLANICHSNNQSRVVPFPLDSSSAALWLLSHGVEADLIYIDGSHEEEAVYRDLADYRQILSPRGVIFGDDWDWASVRAAVSTFARESKLQVVLRQDKWVLSAGKTAK